MSYSLLSMVFSLHQHHPWCLITSPNEAFFAHIDFPVFIYNLFFLAFHFFLNNFSLSSSWADSCHLETPFGWIQLLRSPGSRSCPRLQCYYEFLSSRLIS